MLIFDHDDQTFRYKGDKELSFDELQQLQRELEGARYTFLRQGLTNGVAFDVGQWFYEQSEVESIRLVLKTSPDGGPNTLRYYIWLATESDYDRYRQGKRLSGDSFPLADRWYETFKNAFGSVREREMLSFSYRPPRDQGVVPKDKQFNSHLDDVLAQWGQREVIESSDLDVDPSILRT